MLPLMSDGDQVTDYESSTLGMGYNSSSRLMARERIWLPYCPIAAISLFCSNLFGFFCFIEFSMTIFKSRGFSLVSFCDLSSQFVYFNRNSTIIDSALLISFLLCSNRCASSSGCACFHSHFPSLPSFPPNLVLRISFPRDLSLSLCFSSLHSGDFPLFSSFIHLRPSYLLC